MLHQGLNAPRWSVRGAITDTWNIVDVLAKFDCLMLGFNQKGGGSLLFNSNQPVTFAAWRQPVPFGSGRVLDSETHTRQPKL